MAPRKAAKPLWISIHGNNFHREELITRKDWYRVKAYWVKRGMKVHRRELDDQ